MESNGIADEIRTGLAEISTFVQERPFSDLIAELWALPFNERKMFVREVLINDAELLRRGVVVPDGLTIQRSAFRDGRPTLFCVVKHLPPGMGWEKVTITFDNPDGEPDVSYDELASQAAV